MNIIFSYIQYLRNKKSFNQFRIFLWFSFNGLISVIIAMALYLYLIKYSIVGISLANIFAYAAGLIYGFIANNKFTFKQKKPVNIITIIKYLGLYFTTMCVNLFVNKIFLNLFSQNQYGQALSLMVALIVSTFLNYFGLKLFVFN